MSEDPFAGTEPPGGVDYGSFRFRVKRWALASLVDSAMAAIPTSAAFPALSCFRLHVCDEFLQLAATDMERTVRATTNAVDCPADEGSYFQTFVPAKKLQAILKEAPADADVTVSVVKNQAEITAGNGSWTLTLPDGSSYPALAETAELQFTPYSREKLLAALKAVRHTVCKDAGRPAITQVEIRKTETGMCATSSDGGRMSRAVLEDFPAEMCIPSSALDDLARLLGGSQADDIGIAVTEGDATGSGGLLAFKVAKVVLTVARRSSAFPDVDRLLLEPVQDNEYPLTLDRDELAAAIRRVRITADSDSSAIVIELIDGTARVVSRDKGRNSAVETIVAGWPGPRRVLCVNHVYLAEMLAAHPGKACEFRLGKDVGKRRSMVLLQGDGLVQVLSQMSPALVGYKP